MNLDNPMQRWGGAVLFFHWLVVLLFAFEYGIAQVMEHKTLGMTVKTMFMLHKSVGILLFVAVAARIVARLTTQAPPEVSGPAWQQSAARLTHLALYGVIIMIPFTGYVMSVAGGKDLMWFGQWSVPNIVGIDPALKKLARKAHFFFVDVSIWLIALHVGAVFFHRIAHGTNIMTRMLPWGAQGK